MMVRAHLHDNPECNRSNNGGVNNFLFMDGSLAAQSNYRSLGAATTGGGYVINNTAVANANAVANTLPTGTSTTTTTATTTTASTTLAVAPPPLVSKRKAAPQLGQRDGAPLRSGATCKWRSRSSLGPPLAANSKRLEWARISFQLQRASASQLKPL